MWPRKKTVVMLESNYVDTVVIKINSFAISVIELHTLGVYSQIIKWSTILGCSRKGTSSKTNMMRWAQDKHSSPMYINSNVIIRTTAETCSKFEKLYSHYNRANLTIGKPTTGTTVLVASMPKTDKY
jgi:hypothetical protein